MFSSKGLFKDVSCPYFLFGLCERPYCHFKHSKQEEAKARVEIEKLSNLYTGSDDSTTNGLPVSSLQRTLKDIEQSIQTEKSILGNHSKPSGVTKNKPTGTPSYNPTPLNELEQKKNKGELGSGRSKYDLALLDGPSSDGEYDPASNFSTNLTSVASTSTLSRESPSDFAKPVVAGIKRKSETEDGNEDSCSLAKIPKFASVSYSPAVAEGSFSDEEHSGIPDGFLSDDQSEKARGSGLKSDTTKSCDKKSDLLKENNDIALSKEISPIEFNPDGTVNYPDRSAEDEKLKPKGKDATNEDVKSDKSDENIFSLFKQEFDSVLEGCANIDEQKPCIKTDHNVIKKSHSSGKCRVTNDKETVLGHKSSHHKSKSEKHKHKEITNSHDKIKSSACTPNKSDNTANFNHKDKSCSSNKESSSHNSLSTRQRKDSEKSSSSVVKNGMTKSSSSSKKHSHSDLKHNHRDSKHSHSDSKHSHSNSLKSEQKHKHERMSSKDHSRTSSKDSTDKSSSSASKHNTSSDKSSKHGQHKSHHRSSSSQSHSHPSSKTKSHSSSKSNSHHSSSKSKSAKQSTILSPTSSKKKQILNLDVDLFGDIDSDIEQPSRTADYDSDLEKLFEDDDPFDECLRIFNEENAKQASTSGGEKKKLKRPHEPDTAPASVIGKKRVALKESDPDVRKKKLEDRPQPKPSPAQVMLNRYKAMQEKALQEENERKEKMKAKVKEIQEKNKDTLSSVSGLTKPSLASASATFTTYMAARNKKTSAVTAAKGIQRQAHTPTVPIATLKRPTVEVNTSSKVPTNVRQRYLNMFIDECLKICPNEEQAYKKAKEEEEAVFTRCSNKKIYLNLVVNTIKRYRTEAQAQNSGKVEQKTPVKLSHASLLDGSGPGASKTTYTLHRSGGAGRVQEEDFTGAELYKRLTPYVLTEEQLKENNFPRPHSTRGGAAKFYSEVKTTQKGSTKGYEKLCVRCGKVFEVYPNGKYPVRQECVYHWGKAWKKKIAGNIDTRYTCCQGDLTSEGCQVAKLHVHETNKREIVADMEEVNSGFMKTIPCSPAPDGDYGVYALDCEMVYTTMGVELARVTVVGADLEPVYESLVMPDNRIVDLNTRFSGISEEDLEDVHTSLRDVQAVLLSLFTDKTILLGHSLESDLLALKLIHSTVVDTSVVFPHRMGLPFKRALKNLMAEYLKKIIQDDVSGHDSLEDATACLQLMQHKLKDDARKEGRRLST